MSDQMPYHIELRSGKQMYLASEVASSKRRLTSDEKKLTEKSGGGSQAAASFSEKMMRATKAEALPLVSLIRIETSSESL